MENCAFPSAVTETKLNCLNIISLIAYDIFKENISCKFNKVTYALVSLTVKVKENLLYYKIMMKDVVSKHLVNVLHDTGLLHVFLITFSQTNSRGMHPLNIGVHIYIYGWRNE